MNKNEAILTQTTASVIAASKLRRQRSFRAAVSIYIALWIVTALFGNSRINKSFDRQFAVGFTTLAENEEPKPAVRVPYSREMRNPRNLDSVKAPVWRARTTGFPVAPFVIVDEAAWIDGPLSGFSGIRVVIWFFGYTHWFPLKVFWVS